MAGLNSKIYFGENIKLTRTTQGDFDKFLECCKCKSKMYPLLQIWDNGECVGTKPFYKKVLSRGKNKGIPIFPHDHLCMVVYMCEKCGECHANWNQF